MLVAKYELFGGDDINYCVTIVVKLQQFLNSPGKLVENQNMTQTRRASPSSSLGSKLTYL